MPESGWADPVAPGRPLTLFPADDQRFHDSALLAVELFGPSDVVVDPPFGSRPVDDERLLAAAQAMLRAAYPLAIIVVDPQDPTRSPVAWHVYRDTATLDDDLLRAARTGDDRAAATLADRYYAVALQFAWAICGGPAAATAAVAEAMAQLLRPDVLVRREHVADTLLRMSWRAADAQRIAPVSSTLHPEAEARARLPSILARLSATRAEGLALAYGEGMSEAEVAIALGLDETRASALIREGLAALVEAPV